MKWFNVELEIPIWGKEFELVNANTIDEANLIFEEQSTKANSVEAANSVDYLNKQIAIYDFKLNEAEQNLNKFMMENLSVDFSLESKGLFDKSVQLADQKKEVELKIAEIPKITSKV